ncbi:MAG: type II toxin-antitoxin system RelE family toxin [Bacteroidota bacterium]
MKTEFKASFLKAIKKIKDQQLKTEIADTIKEVESAENLRQIKQLKKLKGYKHYYRIRIKDYRIGLKVEKTTIYFVDIAHRKNIYRFFPK